MTAPLDNLSGKSPDTPEAMCRCAFPDPVEYDGVADTGNGIAPAAWIKFWCDVCSLDIDPNPAHGVASFRQDLGGVNALGKDGLVTAHASNAMREEFQGAGNQIQDPGKIIQGASRG